MKITKPQEGWVLRLEPEEGKKLRICWSGIGINQRWDVGWIEIMEELPEDRPYEERILIEEEIKE